MQSISESPITRLPRVAFFGAVELRTQEESADIRGQAVDLGLGGLALRAARLPQVGERLRCAFECPESVEWVEAQCQVVWVHRHPGDGGTFGVRFLAMEADARRALRKLVHSSRSTLPLHFTQVPGGDEAAFPALEEGQYEPASPLAFSPELETLPDEAQASFEAELHVPPSEPQDSVRLFLESVGTPIRAQLSEADERRLVVESDLPFLRLGSSVGLSHREGLKGTLRSVELQARGKVPRLRLTIDYAEGAAGEEALDTLPDLALPEGPSAAFSTRSHDLAREERSFAAAAAQSAAAPTLGVDDEDELIDTPVFERAPLDSCPAHTPDRSMKSHLQSFAYFLGRVGLRSEERARALLLWLRTLVTFVVGMMRTLGPKLKRSAAAAPTSRVRALKGLSGLQKKASTSLAFCARLLRPSRSRPKLRKTSPPPAMMRQQNLRRPSQGRDARASAAPQKRLRRLLSLFIALGALSFVTYAWLARKAPAPEAESTEAAPAGQEAAAPAGEAEPLAANEEGESIEDEGLPAELPEDALANERSEAASARGLQGLTSVRPRAHDSAAPSPGLTPPSSSYAVDVRAKSAPPAAPAAPAAVEARAPVSVKNFGAAAAQGKPFTLRMSRAVESIEGKAESTGFSVRIPGSLALDRAAPLAQKYKRVEKAVVLNRGDHALLRVEFSKGPLPAYRVRARGASLEIFIEG